MYRKGVHTDQENGGSVLVRLCLLGALGLAAATAAQGQAPPIAQSQRYEIRGNIRSSESGQTIDNVRVDLKLLNGPVVQTTFTRGNGAFQFPGLVNGLYYVEIKLEGYEEFRESIEVYQRSPAPMMIMLRKPIDTSVKVQGKVVSARELALPEKARGPWASGLTKAYQQHDLKGAMKEFRKVLEFAPEYYEAHFHLGMIFQEMGKPAEAKQEYLRSAELSKGEYAEPLVMLAAIHGNENNFVAGEEYSRKALAVDANSYIAYFELARALSGQNRLEEAILAAEQCRVRKPEYVQLYLILANIQIKRRNGPALLGALEEYLKYEPNGPMSEQIRVRRDEIRKQMAPRSAPGAPPGN